ncbi:hypothetical protein MD535_23680 [Vibrio sp. ZSDZ65]|uniref:Uncharacterized protein n=1 Tax=Vibrio qingdaonensis TaxID=2829491 RepID=A0A9X3HZM3_9VIBR|nr:hypothetical protein [Vibrio qingdaonensis]MCW8348997.1 hypothetical protein [Vibrio qingdaonensis]
MITESPQYKNIIREIRELEATTNRKIMHTTSKLSTKSGKQYAERNSAYVLKTEKKHTKLVNRLAKIAGGTVRLEGGVYFIDVEDCSIDTDVTEFQRLYATMRGTIKWLMGDFKVAIPRVDIELLGIYHNGFELRLGEFTVQCIHNPDPNRFIDFYLDENPHEFFDLIDAIRKEHKEAIEEINKRR